MPARSKSEITRQSRIERSKKGNQRIGRAVKGIASSRSNIFCWLPSRRDHAETYREFSNEKKSLNQMKGRDGDEAKEEGQERKRRDRKKTP